MILFSANLLTSLILELKVFFSVCLNTSVIKAQTGFNIKEPVALKKVKKQEGNKKPLNTSKQVSK